MSDQSLSLSGTGTGDARTRSEGLVHITADAVFHTQAFRPVVANDSDAAKKRRATQLYLDLDDE